MKGALCALAVLLMTSQLNASIVKQKPAGSEKIQNLSGCDYSCVEVCRAELHAVDYCANLCGCSLDRKPSIVPSSNLQSLASIYYYEDAGANNEEVFVQGESSATTTHSAQASSFGAAHFELGSTSVSSEAHVSATKSQSSSDVSCSDSINTVVGAETKLTQDVKNAMVEAVLHEIFVLAAESALSGSKTIQFHTSSSSVKDDFHTQIQHVVDEEWNHLNGAASTVVAVDTISSHASGDAAQTSTSTVTTTVTKEAAINVDAIASEPVVETSSVSVEEEIVAEHHESSAEEEIIEQKTTTASTTTSTTTEVVVEKEAVAEVHQEEASVAQEAHVDVAQEASVDLGVHAVAEISTEVHESTIASTSPVEEPLPVYEQPLPEFEGSIIAHVETQEEVHVDPIQVDASATHEAETHSTETHTAEAQTTETHVAETHVAETNVADTHVEEAQASETQTAEAHTHEVSADVHVAAEQVAVETKEAQINLSETAVSHTSTTTTTVIETETVFAGAHHEAAEKELAVVEEHVHVTDIQQTSPVMETIAPSIEVECCPQASISKGEIDKVSKQLQTELSLFKEELLEEMRLAISSEIDALWEMHLTEAGMTTAPAEPAIEFAITAPAKQIQPLHQEQHIELQVLEPEKLTQPTQEFLILEPQEPQVLTQPTLEKLIIEAQEPQKLTQPMQEELILEHKEPEKLTQSMIDELLLGQNETATTHVHEVHVEASGEVHEVHVEEVASNKTHHVHTQEMIVEAVETSHSGENQTLEAIVDAVTTTITHDVEIDADVSAKLDVLVEHEGHVHEAVKEPIGNHSVLVMQEHAAQEEVVTETIIHEAAPETPAVDQQSTTTVVTEVNIDAHVHDAEAEQEATAPESQVEQTVDSVTTTTTTTVEKQMEGEHVHSHEVVVEEAASVAEFIQEKQPVVAEESKGVCQVSTADVMAVPTVTVHTDYWTVSPCSYIDEMGEVRSGHTQKFVTETVTTIQHPSICALPEDVQVEARSSQARNAAGEVVQVTTVVTEQTTVTTNGKQVITIVETTTIDDIKPDEVVLEVAHVATTSDTVVQEDVTVVEDKTVEVVDQHHSESQTTYTATTSHTEVHEVHAETSQDAAVEEVVTTTTVETAPAIHGEVTTTHTEEVAMSADVPVEKTVVDTTVTKSTDVQVEAPIVADVPAEVAAEVVAEEHVAEKTTTTQTTTTVQTTELIVEIAKEQPTFVVLPTEEQVPVEEQPVTQEASAVQVQTEEQFFASLTKDIAPVETHKEVSKTTIVSETEEIQTGLSKATLDSIHAATKTDTAAVEPIPVGDVTAVRTGITKEAVVSEGETVGTLHAEFETASVTKEVVHETCACQKQLPDEVEVIEKPDWMTCQQWTIFVEETHDWSHDMKMQALNAALVAHNLMVQQSAQTEQFVTIRADFTGSIELDVPLGFYSQLLEAQMAQQQSCATDQSIPEPTLAPESPIVGAALHSEVHTSNSKVYMIAVFALLCALAAFYMAGKKSDKKEVQIGGMDEEQLKEPLLAQ